MTTLFDLPDLEPAEAVAAAVTLSETESTAWEALDRVLRGRVVRLLQEGEGDAAPLARALLDAGRAAGGRWLERWFLLLEILRDGRQHPSRAAGAQVLAADQWAARVLKAVAERTPAERKQIRARFGDDLKENHLTNVLATLEGAGLLRRSRVGRETTLLLTPEGRRAAEALGVRAAPLADVPRAARGRSAWRIPAEWAVVD